MAVIALMLGLLALGAAANASRQSAQLRQELDALRAELRGTKPGDAGPGDPSGAVSL